MTHSLNITNMVEKYNLVNIDVKWRKGDCMFMKKRKEKERIYESKYSDIPRDYNERIQWMCDKYRITNSKMNEILEKKFNMETSLVYNDFKVILYEEPEGSPRPRFRLVNRFNLANEAMTNSNFVHVYSINAHEDSVYMKRLIDNELVILNHLIYTPCIVEYNTYHKTPSVYNTTDTFLAEIGLERPISKPDWDNIGKKYSDMYNSNVWIDDTLVISGTVNKYFSILPRVEINIRYLNMLYNVHQYRSMSKKLNDKNIRYYGGIQNGF